MSSTTNAPITVNNLTGNLKPSPVDGTASSNVKPCCVCKDEKAARDECMLFSSSDDAAQRECKDMVTRYRSCMASYGFNL